MLEEIEKLQKQQDMIQDSINKLREVVSKTENSTWPMQGDDYWYICGDGEIGEDIWAGANTADKLYLEIGNCFKTREEAELAVQKLKALKRLRDKGFKFEGVGLDDIQYSFNGKTLCKERDCRAEEDLDLLFREEE